MANKISVLIDVATDKAVSGLKGFKQSINDADGAVGKMKAGAASAFDSIKANAGNMAMVAGAAIVTFGVKAVAEFQDAALAAGKFADATGLSTETASKWTAVADDIGISSDSMEKSFGKLAQSIGKNNPLLEEYGITVKKGADGQADMNATMLNAIDVIKGIQDPTKKAAVAQAALGKGWMDMAELIEIGSDDLTKSMENVSEAQIIDEQEVAKARKMRESMDNLQDSLRDVALVVGEDLVPAVSMLAEGLVTIIKPISAVHQWSNDLAFSFGELVGVIDSAPPITEDAATGIGHMGVALGEAERQAQLFTSALDFMDERTQDNTVSAEALAMGEKKAADARADATRITKEHTRALEDQMKATDELFESKLELVGGDIAVRDSQRQAAEEVAALNLLMQEGKGFTEEYAVQQDAAAQTLIDSAAAASDYEIAQREANGETLSGESKTNLYRVKLEELAGTLAPGSPLRAQIDGYIADLESVPNEINTRFVISASGATVTPHGDEIRPGQRAAGGPVSSGQTYLVGERGPELVTMGGHGYVTPNSELGVSGGTSINLVVNAGLGADGKEIGDVIVGKLREYERRNGPGWRS